MGERDVSAMYSCYFQSDLAVVNLNFMIRSALPPTSLVKEIGSALTSVDSAAAIEVKPMEKSMALAMLPSQIGATLLGSMGVLALLLASIGLYDPARSQEVFRVAMSDHASMIVLPSLLAGVRRAATHVKLEVSASGVRLMRMSRREESIRFFAQKKRPLP
jgi:hypothetical protein